MFSVNSKRLWVLYELVESLSSKKDTCYHLGVDGWWSQERRPSSSPLGANFQVALLTRSEVSLWVEWWHHKLGGSQPLREVAPSSMRGGNPLLEFPLHVAQLLRRGGANPRSPSPLLSFYKRESSLSCWGVENIVRTLYWNYSGIYFE